MKNRTLLILWAGMYFLTVGLGCVPSPGAGWMLTLVSLLFFLPPAVLLYRGERSMVLLIRNLSIASLSLTLVMIVLNILVATASKIVGQVTYAFLILLTAPMVSSQIWALSIFCWACLLFASLAILKRKK